MKNILHFQLFLIISFVDYSGYPQTISEIIPAIESFPPVTIPRTELRVLHSNIMNRDFEIYVKLPNSYHQGDSHYPVVYFTDGNRSFPMVENISFILEFPGDKVRESIVAGIGYPTNDLSDWSRLRTQDLTPTSVPAVENSTTNYLRKITGDENIYVKTGGAAEFMKFIKDELIPFMEKQYRIDAGERILAGYSYGGLFSILFMFHYPETFSKYFAGSPSLGYDQRVIFTYEKDYALSHNDLNASLYMTTGGQEEEKLIHNVMDMKDTLIKRNYPGFRIKTDVFEGQSHQSCYPVAVSRAFKVLLGTP